MGDARNGAVLFSGNIRRLAAFYEAVTGLATTFADDAVIVLASESFELVIHALPSEPEIRRPPEPRHDAYIKPFFAVESLSATRLKALAAGGTLRPSDEEWEARGFRACDAVDPDGNIIQFRESIA
jgi:predicted enzyme related to lactoylglutathione lyase